jgi:hypothetical protein
MFTALIELFMKGISACGCLLTLAAGGLVLCAIFLFDTPARQEGRNMAVFLALIAALFGLPILLGGRRGRGGKE